MPQGRRKAPFSGKAKKQQMQAKKHRKQTFLENPQKQGDDVDDHSELGKIQKINKQPRDTTGRDRYALQFFQESKEELQHRKEEGRKTIHPLPLDQQEVSSNYFPEGLNMPKRPPWDFSMSRELLDMREQKYFIEYLRQLESIKDISYFELNLETWRQLWRVLEMSDIFLIIVDIRYPVLMFPPYLYNYVTNDLKKDMILVLNKIDLASPALVLAWREYFQLHYPTVHILFFTSFPKYNLRGNQEDGEGLKQRRRRGKLRMAAEGAQKLLSTCKAIVRDQVDLSSWQEKIHEEMQMEYDLEDIDHKENTIVKKEDTSYFEHEKYKNGVLTIGCIGTPNVGKSSLMNALMGKKVVSVSRTPGHTKHFQTIYLTKTVCLCDCPGLVFPSTVPKQLQILMGSFPIAQVREPYTTIKFLGERLDLPKLLRIQHQENDETWSALDICEGWAAKRNYRTARTARLDTYRAANSLLRMALEGKICIFVYPERWSKEKERWEKHEDVEMIRWIQASVKEGESDYCGAEGEHDSYSEDEDSEKSDEGDNSDEEEGDEDDDDDDTEHGEGLMVSGNRFGALADD
ncbi:guanine nucleotide-binding protein-like 1 [Diachasma alloeum]|uniref:guanine nucleotide-binding protein-like 1 n=1 Tax=Diachasma alloeum TaxID=454923 RepID=UPI0007383B7D|nr:guanine nucleotide-binding protein-like 1 [Diachasma alloeum]